MFCWLTYGNRSNSKNAKKFVTIKINVNTLTPDFLDGRRSIAHKLKTTNPIHRGYNHVRFMLETFTIKGKYGEHLCVVYDVLREPLDECQQRLPSKLFKSDHLRALLPSLLKGLEYMHSECHVVHTDLKADNIMMGLGSDPNAVLDRFVNYTMLHPPPRKPPDSNDGHTIYKSSSDLLLVGDNPAPTDCINEGMLLSAKITDIGLAEWGDRGLQHKAIQTNAFTCPEVLLDAGWSYPADIWNLGVMMWDLIEDMGLFDLIDTSPGHYKGEQHLALMITLLGPPPQSLLHRGMKTSKYFDYDKEKEEFVFRSTKYLEKYDGCLSWDKAVRKMQGPNKESFIDFAKKMICWEPEERWTASQLLEHPWLRARPGSVTCTPKDFEEARSSMRLGLEEDARMELVRRSTNVSLASGSGVSDTGLTTTTSSSRHGNDSPPTVGIVHRSTEASYLNMAEVKSKLPPFTSTTFR